MPDYLGAIDDVLEQYDFRKIGPGKEKNRERMLAYVEMMKAAGRENEIAIPPHILENAKADPYMTLTVEHLRGVYTPDPAEYRKHSAAGARRAGTVRLPPRNERDMDAVVNDPYMTRVWRKYSGEAAVACRDTGRTSPSVCTPVYGLGVECGHVAA